MDTYEQLIQYAAMKARKRIAENKMRKAKREAKKSLTVKL
jgi:hypothetical protein